MGHTDDVPGRFTSIAQRQDSADKMQPQDKMDPPRMTSDEIRKEDDRRMMQ